MRLALERNQAIATDIRDPIAIADRTGSVDGPAWLSGDTKNWLARRRIAISLIGFSSLVCVNLFVVGNTPMNPFAWDSALSMTALCMTIIGLAIRSWSAGTLNKSRELTTTGPYSLVRNPLYVGSFLMMFAFCIFCRDLPTLCFVAGPMSFLYWIQVAFEERRLNNLFPGQWPGYQSRVPRFIPRQLTADTFKGWTTAEWLRNREYRTLGATCFGIVGLYVWHVLTSG